MACRLCSWTAAKPWNERPSGIAYFGWSSFAMQTFPDRNLVTLGSVEICIASAIGAPVAPRTCWLTALPSRFSAMALGAAETLRLS